MAEAEKPCSRCPDLERRIERLERDLARDTGLAQRIAIIEAENRDLRARLNLTSRNSSKPPSSDPPSAPPRPTAAPTGRKQGGQPGHPGVKRQEFSEAEVDHRIVRALLKREWVAVW